MKLVCIDTKDWYKNLTLNKIYDASPMTEESLRHIFDYIIIDDNGFSTCIEANVFITLHELRNKKLNEIGI